MSSSLLNWVVSKEAAGGSFLCRKGESSFLFEHSVHRGVRSKCIIVLNNKVVIIISKLQENIVIHSALCDRVMPADPLSLLLNTGKIGQKFFRSFSPELHIYFIQTKSHGPVWQPTRRGPSARRVDVDLAEQSNTRTW